MNRYVVGIDGCVALAYVGRPSSSVSSAAALVSSSSGTRPSGDPVRARSGKSSDVEAEEYTESARGAEPSLEVDANGEEGVEVAGLAVSTPAVFETCPAAVRTFSDVRVRNNENLLLFSGTSPPATVALLDVDIVAGKASCRKRSGGCIL